MARKFLTSLDLTKNELLNPRFQNLGTAPATPAEGQFYYNSTGGDKTAYFWDGTTWVAMKSGTPTFGSPVASAVGDSAADGVNSTSARSDHKHARESFATNTVALGSAAAAGSATTLIRSDATIAAFDATSPSTQAIGDSAVVGTAAFAARRDHKHAMPAFATNAVVLGTAAAAGVATTLIRSDATIAAFDATAPTTQAIGDSATVGTIAFAARRDHLHGMPAFATNAVVLGTAAAAGSATTLIRSDATIAAFDATSPSTQAIGDSAVVGTAAFAARRDHKHAMPAFGNVTAQTSFGASSANGTATSLSHSDHVHGTPTHLTADHSAVSISGLSAPTADVGWGGFKITNLATPTAATDAATKGYVDGVSTGLDVKLSVRVASTANVSVTYAATGGASARGQITAAPNTLDGVSLAANDRLLLKDQTTGAQNGIWVVTTLGTGANGVWDRATDFDQDVEVTAGAFTFVEEGTVNADSGWVLSSNQPVVIGGAASPTSLVFVQFSGAGQITAGTGLTKTGNTLNVGAGTGILANADDVAIDTAVVVRKYAASFGDGAATSYNIDHNLATLDVIVQVYTVSDGTQVEPDITRSTTNRVVLAFTVAPTSNQYRVVVHA